MNDLFPIKRSDLLQRYLLEVQQLERLKWIESEKVGYDIGIERARWLWHTTYRAGWLVSLHAQSQSSEIHSQ